MHKQKFIDRLARKITGRFLEISSKHLCTYSIYTNMKISTINMYADSPDTVMSSYEIEDKLGDLTLDLAICDENRIVLCIMVDCENDDIKYLFDTKLKNIKYTAVNSNEFSNEEFDDLIGYINDAVKQYESSIKNAYYALTFSLQSLSPDLAESNKKINILISQHFIDNELNITEYGLALGLVNQYIFDIELYDRVKRHTMRISQNLSKMYTDGFHNLEFMPYGMTTLKSKIDRLEKTLPSDDVYEQHTVDKLKEFLDTPLDFFSKNCTEEYNTLSGSIRELRSLAKSIGINVSQFETLLSYRDFVNFVVNLKEMGFLFEKESCYDKFSTYLSNIIIDTGNMLVSDNFKQSLNPCENTQQNPESKIRSLKKRTEQDCRYFVMHMPLKQYYYAASLIADNSYSSWLYQEKVLDRVKLNRTTEWQYSILTSIYNAYGQYNNQEMSYRNLYILLYNLLFAPVADVQYYKNIQQNKNRQEVW